MFKREREYEAERNDKRVRAEGGEIIPQMAPPEGLFSGQISETIVDWKKHSKIQPKTGNVYTQNNYIRFEIPSQDFLLTKTVRTTFNVKFESAPGFASPFFYQTISQFGQRERAPFSSTIGGAGFQNLRASNGICSMFNRVRLLHGSTPIEDIFAYNVLDKVLNLRYSLDTTEQRLAKEGYGSVNDGKTFWNLARQACETIIGYDVGIATAARNTLGIGHGYEIDLCKLFGFFDQGKWLPLEEMQTLAIELYLAPNVEFLVSSALSIAPNNIPTADFPTSQYTMQNIYLHYDTCRPNSEYINSLKTKIKSSGLDIHYCTWYNHINQLVNVSGKNVLTVQERAKSVKAMVSIMRLNTDIADLRTDQGKFTNGNLINLQWQVGSNYYPLQPIETIGGGVQLWQEALDWLGYSDSKVNGVPVNNSDFAAFNCYEYYQPLYTNPLFHINNSAPGNQFFMVLDLEKTKNQISGYNTVDDVVDLQILLTLGDSYNFFPGPSTNEGAAMQHSYFIGTPTPNDPGEPPGSAQSYINGNLIPGATTTVDAPGLVESFPSVNESITLYDKGPTQFIRVDSFCWVDQIFQLQAPLQAVIKR